MLGETGCCGCYDPESESYLRTHGESEALVDAEAARADYADARASYADARAADSDARAAEADARAEAERARAEAESEARRRADAVIRELQEQLARERGGG